MFKRKYLTGDETEQSSDDLAELLPVLTYQHNQFPSQALNEFTTGWDKAIIFLLLHALVDVLWGIALAIFTTGIVEVDWVISEWAKGHTSVVTIFITLVATLSTTHVRYLYQLIIYDVTDAH